MSCFACAGKADDQVNDCKSDARISRPGVLVCVHAAAPEWWQGPGNAKRPPGRKPAARNRGTYLQTVPAPSAKRQGRVTDAPAHMPTTVPMKRRVARRPS